MRIWINCISILLIILGTLPTAENLLSSKGNIDIDGLLIILIIVNIVLFIVQKIFSRQQSGLYGDVTSNNSLNKLSNFSISKSTLFLQTLIFCLILCGSSIYTIKVVRQEINKDIPEQIRVLAKVKVVEISDSLYYPESDMSYRQLAIIEVAYPLSLSILDKPNITDNLSADINLSGKRVLLSAYNSPTKRKNSDLPSGYSNDFSMLNQLQPSQSAYMLLALKPVSLDNDEGFLYRWLRSRHVNATANILAYQINFLPNNDVDWLSFEFLHQRLNLWRWNLRQYFLYHSSENWNDLDKNNQQAVGVTLSLLTGDRALISRQTKDLYQLAGISHLLAISGAHVLFLAIILSSLMVGLVNRFYPMLYQRITRSNLRWLTMVFGALLYAMFTGFDVPSARTVYMLVAVGISRLLILDVSTRKILLIIAVLMAVFDPYILWQAGFWLSFTAVMLLISYEVSMRQTTKSNEDTTLALLSKQLFNFIKLQVWMFISLLPLSLMLFGKVSVWGVLINIFAIGFYGLIIVPLNLFSGMVYVLLPSVASVIWELVIWLLKTEHAFLFWLTGVDIVADAWIYTDINAGIILILSLIVLPMLTPRGVIHRSWSLPPFCLLMLVFYNQSHQRLGMTNSQPKLIIVSSKFMKDRTHINSLLLSSSNDKWLIISEYSNTPKSSKEMQTYSSELANQLSLDLLDDLKKLGVSSLTGIIVQSPSQKLMYASQFLKNKIPVGYVWQAGSDNLVGNNKFPSLRPCEEGSVWKSEDSSLSIKAIAGWQEIKDKDFWSCVLQIESDHQLDLYSQYSLYWMNTLDKKIHVSNDEPSKLSKSKKLIINAGDSNSIWKLWSLMCTIDEKTDYSRTFFLTDSRVNDKKQIYKLVSFNHLILLNNSKNNSQQLLDDLFEFNNRK